MVKKVKEKRKKKEFDLGSERTREKVLIHASISYKILSRKICEQVSTK